MTSASAPGKIILFGEHAVVYNRPALAVPITQVHADVKVNGSQRPGIWINAPDIDVHGNLKELHPGHPLRSVVEHILSAQDINSLPGLEIHITSSIPVASGLGSGAAVSVATIRALSNHLGLNLADGEVNNICYEVEKIHHGTPSGIDNTVITYQRPVFFVKGQPVETFHVAKPFTFIIADTGIRAPTKESVGDVRRLWESKPDVLNKIFDQIAEIARKARRDIESGAWQDLGKLMDLNQAYLRELTVSSAELERLVLEAKSAGALGAKLSGGGRGGNMIALVEPETAERIASALKFAGARRTIITTVQALTKAGGIP